MLGHALPWDTVQMPINVCDAHYRSFQEGRAGVSEKERRRDRYEGPGRGGAAGRGEDRRREGLPRSKSACGTP